MTARVLLVEDEAALRDAYSYLLRKDGYDVVEAADAAEALRRAGEERPDLVILDLLLPDRSGADVCRELRAERPELPILVLTARSDDDARDSALAAGADAVVLKPTGAPALLAQLRRLLERPRG